ncbi:MAG TPA: tetratricopeptide repeat protein [Deltaproteobacteria bacterium]|nr:tetratricopeptide repeat protein [Deltaproteobacteria bacterium]
MKEERDADMMIYFRQRIGWFPLVWICMSLSGCATVMPAPAPRPLDGSAAVKTEESISTETKPDPRATASLQFTEQGRILLERGRPDDAIAILEQALSIYPNNGQNYYYLAEAWLTKGDILQADEWNRLAKTYLLDDPDWTKRVREQRVRIRKFIK